MHGCRALTLALARPSC